MLFSHLFNHTIYHRLSIKPYYNRRTRSINGPSALPRDSHNHLELFISTLVALLYSIYCGKEPSEVVIFKSSLLQHIINSFDHPWQYHNFAMYSVNLQSLLSSSAITVSTRFIILHNFLITRAFKFFWNCIRSKVCTSIYSSKCLSSLKVSITYLK